jgi:hypothetical protein
MIDWYSDSGRTTIKSGGLLRSAGTEISPKILRESLKYFFLGLTHSQLKRISRASNS